MPIIFISTIVVLTLLSLNFSAFSSLSPSAASSASLRRQQPRVNFEFLPPPPTLKPLPHRNDSSFRFQYSADSEDVGYEIGSDSSNDDGEKNFEELSSAVLNGDFNDDDDDDDVREGIHQDSIDEETFDDDGAGNVSNKRGKIAWLMRYVFFYSNIYFIFTCIYFHFSQEVMIFSCLSVCHSFSLDETIFQHQTYKHNGQ